MSTTGLDSLDRTVQETNLWLKRLMALLDTEDRHAAWGVLRAGLHALRDRIGPENAVHLGAQLPMLLRGLYYESWHMAGTPSKERHVAPFLEHLKKELPRGSTVDPEAAAVAVFALLWEKVDPGECTKVARLLPREVRALWPIQVE